MENREEALERLYLPLFKTLSSRDQTIALKNVLTSEYTVEHKGDHLEVIFNGMPFVFIPGCKNVELGWSVGDKVPDEMLESERCLSELCFGEGEGEEESREEEEAQESQDSNIKPKRKPAENEEAKREQANDEEIHEDEEEEEEVSLNEEGRRRFTVKGFINEIDSRTSPRRRADIGPMLVEPKIQQTSLPEEDVVRDGLGPTTPEEDSNPGGFRPGDKFSGIASQGGVVVGRRRHGRHTVVYRYYSRNDLKKALRYPFRLMTEDEWEYMYTGTTRQLMPTHYPWLEIALDPYKYEVVDSPCIVKGGDGGCCCCGGEGHARELLALCPFYRDGLDGGIETYADEASSFNNFRRMIRIEDVARH